MRVPVHCSPVKHKEEREGSSGEQNGRDSSNHYEEGHKVQKEKDMADRRLEEIWTDTFGHTSNLGQKRQDSGIGKIIFRKMQNSLISEKEIYF